MENFKNACNTNQINNKNLFKVPQPPDGFNVPLSVKPVEMSNYISQNQKRPKIFNELKVFNNLNNNPNTNPEIQLDEKESDESQERELKSSQEKMKATGTKKSKGTQSNLTQKKKKKKGLSGCQSFYSH
jgi:hypothetical protein